MKRTALGALSLSLLSSLVLAGPPKKDDGVDKALKEIRTSYATALEKNVFPLCIKTGQKKRAEEIVDKISRLVPGRPLEALDAQLQGCVEKVSAKDDKDIADKLRKAGEAPSTKLLDLAKKLYDAHQSIRCVEALSEALDANADHPNAEKIRGFEQIDDGGKKIWVSHYEADLRKNHVLITAADGKPECWIQKKDKASWDKGLRPTWDGHWIPEKEERDRVKEHDMNWYVVESEHFAVKTPISRADAYEFGQLLEDYYKEYFKAFIAFFDDDKGLDYLLNRAPLKEKYRVFYYPDKHSYDLHVDNYHHGSKLLHESAGFFSAETVDCYPASHFYKTERKKDVLATTYHEVTHQLFSQTRKDESARSKNNNWVVEGVACYVETWGKDSKNNWVPGFDLNNGYLREAKAFLAEHPDWKLGELLATDHDTFHADGVRSRNYALSCALVYFLMHADGGQRREECVRFISDYYAGNVDLEEHSLPKKLGTDEATLARQFRDYMTKLPSQD
jgi:hypothetical protein